MEASPWLTRPVVGLAVPRTHTPRRCHEGWQTAARDVQTLTGSEDPPEESRRGLIGRPEGRPRRKGVLKDAGAPLFFRTDSAVEAGLQPARSPIATPQPPLSASRETARSFRAPARPLASAPAPLTTGGAAALPSDGTTAPPPVLVAPRTGLPTASIGTWHCRLPWKGGFLGKNCNE